MKTSAAVLALVLILPSAHSQSREEAVHWAHQISKSAGKLKDAPFQAPLHLYSSVLFKQDGIAALIMPVEGMNRDWIKQAGAKPVPLGALWFLGVKPATGKHAAFADEKLQVATIQSNGEHRLHGALLAVRQNGEHKELLVYGRGQQPLLTIPMTEMLLHQRGPIDILATDEDDRRYLVLHLYGRFMVRIPVVTGLS